MVLDNREIAALTWLLILGLWGALRPDVRRSFRSVAAAPLNLNLLIPLLIFCMWAVGLAAIGHRVGLWTPALVKDTVIWALGPGIALLFELVHAADDPHFFRRTALATIRLGVVVAFFINFFVLWLPLELVLQPLIAALVIMSLLAERSPEHRHVKSLVDGALALMGFALLAFVAYRFTGDPGTVATWDTFRQFTLPVWLTVGSLPLIFALAVYSAYEVAFGHLGLGPKDLQAQRRAKLALMMELRLRFREVGSFRNYWAHQAVKAGSIRGARTVVRQFLEDRAEATRKVEEKAGRLSDNAGVAGTDELGQQLDQREFEETRRALQALATAQMGWYQNRGGRYREELLEILDSRFQRAGLPDEHGIHLMVADDGQSWWAWRRTVTGWCFAIGAANPPPDEWLYDGPDLPTGPPGEDSSWGDRWGTDAPNW